MNERIAGGRQWAAFMLATTFEVYESIAAGRPVLARRLDPTVLRRALRGGQLPHPDAFITVSVEELDAINEAGPLRERRSPW